MECTLANAISTTTNGPTAGIQLYGATDPMVVEVYGIGVGTSGAIAITLQIQESADASSWTTVGTVALDGTFTSKPFAVQQLIRKPYVRVNVSAISGTGAAITAHMRCC